MITEQKPLPTWILIVSGFFALMEIGVSISICISPQSVLENVDVGAKGVEYLANMWAARQFALGFIFAFATFKKSVPMLTIAYIFFLVMFIGDLVIGIVHKENPLVISALVMCAVSSALLVALNKRK
jgi:hypothetical protein